MAIPAGVEPTTPIMNWELVRRMPPPTAGARTWTSMSFPSAAQLAAIVAIRLYAARRVVLVASHIHVSIAVVLPGLPSPKWTMVLSTINTARRWSCSLVTVGRLAEAAKHCGQLVVRTFLRNLGSSTRVGNPSSPDTRVMQVPPRA